MRPPPPENQAKKGGGMGVVPLDSHDNIKALDVILAMIF